VLAFIILGIVAIPLLWSAISPRSLWAVVGRSQYRNPDAVEPSAASFVLWRIVAIVMLGVMAWTIWSLVTYTGGSGS
jgi:hypothetical protein